MTATVGVTRVIEIDVKASANAAAHLKQISDQLGGLDKTAKNTQGSMTKFFDSVTGSAKAFVGFFIGNKAIEITSWFVNLSDRASVMNERFRLVTGSAEGMTLAISEVARISREQGRDMEGTAKLYEKIVRQQEQLGITTKGVTVLTEGFAASLRLSGAGTNEANAAMVQFAQALASGKIAGDEFRSMMENNPVFMYKMAEAAGITTGKLKDMSKEGKIDMVFLREALFKTGEDGTNALQKLTAEAAKLPKTTAQAVEGVKTSLSELLGALGQTADKSEGIFVRMLKGIQGGLSDAAQLARDNAEIARVKNNILNPSQFKGEELELGPRETSNLRMINQKIQLKNEIDKLTAELGRAKSNSTFAKAAIETLRDRAAEIVGIDAALERNIKISEKLSISATLLGKIPVKEPEKEKKGPKGRSNPWSALLGDIEDAERGIEEKAQGWGKMRQKVEDLYREEERKGKDGIMPKGKQLEQALASAARADAALEEATANAENWKLRRASWLANADEYTKRMGAAQAEVAKYTTMFDEDTGAQLGPWTKKFNDMVAMLKSNVDSINADDWKKLNKYKDFLQGKSEFENDKAYAMSLFSDGNPDEAGKRLSQGEHMFASTFDRMLDSMLQFNKSGKEIMQDFVTDFLRQIAKVELAKATAGFVREAGGWITNALRTMGAAAGDSAGSTMGGTSAYEALGGVYDAGVRKFARGGVVNGATGFNHSGGRGVMGEAGPEAIMPLQRGSDGRLGIGATPVTVNVINNVGGAKASASESTNSKGEREITVMIEKVMEGSLAGGRMDKVLGNNFNISRTGKG